MKITAPIYTLLFLLLWLGCTAAFGMGDRDVPRVCPPTEEDEMGPFYRPGAQERSAIGRGYILSGRILSGTDCTPIAAARIEIWQAAPGGHYDDAHRATLFSARDGGYRLETDIPPPYVSRPPHIHLRISAPGFLTLVTQHYVQKGISRGRFDLVLVASP